MTNSSAPAQEAFAITPSDTTELGYRGIYVGSAGNINVLPFSGSIPVLFKNVLAGTILPIQVKKVLATNTTATDLIGLR